MGNLQCDKNKILYVVEAMGGGIFTYLVDLANNLVDKYDIYIAYAVRKQTPENFKSYFDKHINFIKVENFERSINPFKDIKAFFEIKKIAKQVKPDIIHLHSSKAGALGRMAYNSYNIPMFYTPHGYSFLMLNQNKIKRYIYKIIESICGKCNCTTIGCSLGEYEESLKISKKAVYVNNGINISALQKILDSIKVLKKEKITVFTLGRICYQKNPELFNKIALSMPDVDFIWIGDGELKYVLTAPNIYITGWVERTEALKYAISANVFMLTSLWEGLPMSLLEAMYMKKICVVSNVIGNNNTIHNNENGFVCDDFGEFIKAIECCKHEHIVKNLIENAFHDICIEYNTDVMAEKYNKIYSKALNK